MMKEGMFKKGLVFAIIILFIGVAIQPGISTNTIQDEKTVVDAKDYLFQTIIEISNNPDVKELLKQNNQRLFTSDYDYKSVFLQILFKKPRLLKSILFTRPKMTYEYLETNYNRGLEMVDIFGEVESLKIVESVKITNPDLLNKLNNIIMNNEKLNNKITKLTEMNNKLKPDPPFEGKLNYCVILIILAFFYLIMSVIFYILGTMISYIFKIKSGLLFISETFAFIIFIICYFYASIGCWPF